jgi:hypothetical protein
VEESEQLSLDRRQQAIEAIREYERARYELMNGPDRCAPPERQGRKTMVSAADMQRYRENYERAVERLRTTKLRAIGCLTLVGKQLTIDGYHYRSIPSRLEIQRKPIVRGQNRIAM